MAAGLALTEQSCSLVVSSPHGKLSRKPKSVEKVHLIVKLGRNTWNSRIVARVTTPESPRKAHSISRKLATENAVDSRPLVLLLEDSNDVGCSMSSRASQLQMLPDLNSESAEFKLFTETLTFEREWAIAFSDPLPAFVTRILTDAKILVDKTKPLDDNFVSVDPQKDARPSLKIRKGLSARQRRLKARKESSAQRETFAAAELLSVTPTTGQDSSSSRRKVEGGDAVTSYLTQIGKVKLLTRREEVLLAERLQSAIKMMDAKERLKKELGDEPTNAQWARILGMEVKDLMRHVQDGTLAKNKLVLANLRLVVSVAKKYTKSGMELSDLIQAGTVGLQRGVEKFDPTRGFKMSTYVHWWIRQSINRALAVQGLTVRVPMHAYETWSQIRAAKCALRTAGQEPTAPSLAEYLGQPEKKIHNALRVHRSFRSLEDNIWNSRTPDDDGTCLHQFVADNSDEASPWRTVDQKHLKVEIHKLIHETLDPREREIVRSHFGLDRTDGLTVSMENISKRLGISRERARQLEAVALRRLRSKCVERELERYLFDEEL